MTCFTRLPEGATTDGVEYEQKLVGLVALRARSHALRFEVNSNVGIALPFDDVLFRFVDPSEESSDNRKWMTYFIQLKHKTNTKPMSLSTFVNDRDFKLDKYFEFFLKLRKWHRELKEKGNVAEIGQEERDICGGSLDDCRFVIYTTRNAWKTAKPYEEDKEVHKKAFEILRSGEETSNVLRFCEADRKVWNLLKGDENETVYQQEFLPKLRIFCGQSNNSELDSLIRNEAETLFGDPFTANDDFLHKYLNHLKEWTQAKGVVSCLTEETKEYEKFIAEWLRERVKKTGSSKLLVFGEHVCKYLRKTLNDFYSSSFDVLNIKVPGVSSGLRATKLFQVMDASKDGWVFIGSKTLKTFTLKPLIAVCNSKHCKVVVLDVKDASNELNEFLPNILKNVKIIYFGEISHKSPLKGKFCSVMEFEDEWRLCQLTDAFQKKTLELKVLFQGKEIRLRDLEEITWPRLRLEGDGALLEALDKDELQLGMPPPPAHDYEHPELFIERRVYRKKPQISFSEASSSSNNCSSHEGDSSSEVGSLSEEGSSWEGISSREGSPSELGLPSENVSISETHFSSEKNNLYDDYYFFELDIPSEKGSFFDSSDGESSSSEDSNYSFGPLIDQEEWRLEDVMDEHECAFWNKRVVLLVGDAGAGKSSFFKSVAAKKRVYVPTYWAIFLSMLEYGALLDKMPQPQEMTVQHVKELLVASADISTRTTANASRRCVEAALQSGAITVFVDGVDELCPAYSDKVLQLIKLLVHETKAKIWVSSRPEVKQSLQSILHCDALFLKPITLEEQIRFLRCWSIIYNCQSWISEIIENLSNIPSGILASPLHLQMLCEVEGNFLQTSTTGYSKTLSARDFINLYHHFTKRKYEQYINKYVKGEAYLKNTQIFEINKGEFLLLHKYCAIFQLVTGKQFHVVDLQQIEEYINSKNEMLKKEKTGIVWMTKNGKPRFSHYSFVEYFAACWLSENITSSEIAREMARQLFLSHYSTTLRALFDYMVTESCPLHRALVEKNYISFQVNLKSVVSADRDLAGRTALHIAVLKCNQAAVSALLSVNCDFRLRDELFDLTPWQYVDLVVARKGVDEIIVKIAEELFQNDTECILPIFMLVYQNHTLRIAIKNECEKLIQLVLGYTTINTYVDALHKNTTDFIARYDRRSNIKIYQTQCILLNHSLRNLQIKISCLSWLTQLLGLQHLPQFLDLQHIPRLCFPNRNKGNSAWLSEDGTFPEQNAGDKPRSKSIHLNGGQELGQVYILKNWIRMKHEWAYPRLFQQLYSRNIFNLMNPVFNSVYLKNLDKSILEAIEIGNEKIFEKPIYSSVFKGDAATLQKELNELGVINLKKIFGITPLSLALIKGHVECTEYLLEFGASVNGTYSDERTPLQVALESKNLDVINKLIKHGADIKFETSLGLLPLHIAVIKEHIDIIPELIKLGCDINSSDKKGFSSLHYATSMNSIKIVKILCKAGADPNINNRLKCTPLHFACISNAAECAEYLLRKGARLNDRNYEGLLPLHFAALHGHPEMLKITMTDNEMAKEKDRRKRSPLMYAAMSGNLECVEYVLQFKVDPNEIDMLNKTSLHYAAKCGHSPVIRKLLDAGADINATTFEGNTPISLAVRKGNKDCVDYLLERGADPEIPNNNNCTPLHFSARRGKIDITEALLRAQVNVNARSTEDYTPLHTAARFGHIECVTRLLRYEANLNSRTKVGEAPLHLATMNGHSHVVKELIDFNADVNAKMRHGHTPLFFAAYNCDNICVKHLLEGKADPDETAIDGRTPLHCAVFKEEISTIKMLLNAKANVNASTSEGVTPLIFAAERGSVKCVITLLENNADVNRTKNNGWSALHAATKRGSLNIIKMLIEKNANINARDFQSVTPLEVAKEIGNKECAEYLQEVGATC